MKTFDVKWVERYAQLKAQIKKLDEERLELREDILKAFNSGERCPETCPFILEHNKIPKRKLDWKLVALALAVRFFRDQDRAEAYIKRKWDKAPTSDVEEIEVKVNPKWRSS